MNDNNAAKGVSLPDGYLRITLTGAAGQAELMVTPQPVGALRRSTIFSADLVEASQFTVALRPLANATPRTVTVNFQSYDSNSRLLAQVPITLPENWPQFKTPCLQASRQNKQWLIQPTWAANHDLTNNLADLAALLAQGCPDPGAPIGVLLDGSASMSRRLTDPHHEGFAQRVADLLQVLSGLAAAAGRPPRLGLLTNAGVEWQTTVALPNLTKAKALAKLFSQTGSVIGDDHQFLHSDSSGQVYLLTDSLPVPVEQSDFLWPHCLCLVEPAVHSNQSVFPDTVNATVIPANTTVTAKFVEILVPKLLKPLTSSVTARGVLS